MCNGVYLCHMITHGECGTTNWYVYTLLNLKARLIWMGSGQCNIIVQILRWHIARPCWHIEADVNSWSSTWLVELLTISLSLMMDSGSWRLLTSPRLLSKNFPFEILAVVNQTFERIQADNRECWGGVLRSASVFLLCNTSKHLQTCSDTIAWDL